MSADEIDRRVDVEYDVEVTADQVRHLRTRDRLGDTLRVFGGLSVIALAGFLFLRADEWTKGYLTRWLAMAAVLLAGGTAARPCISSDSHRRSLTLPWLLTHDHRIRSPARSAHPGRATKKPGPSSTGAIAAGSPRTSAAASRTTHRSRTWCRRRSSASRTAW